MIHETLWERLVTLETDDVCRRADAEYLPDAGCYQLLLINRVVQVDPNEQVVRWSGTSPGSDGVPDHDVSLVSVMYLLGAKEVFAADDWVSAEALPAGAFFFRGLHAIPTAPVEARFGADCDAFLHAGLDMGGEILDWGDASLHLQVLPRIATRLVLWLGDDEFPARVNMLFDRVVDQHLPLDALGCMARYVTTSLIRAADAV